MSDQAQPSVPVTDPLSVLKAEKPGKPVDKPEQSAEKPIENPSVKPERSIKKITIRPPTNDQRVIANLRLNNASMHKQIGNMIANYNQLSSLLITKTHRIRVTVRIASKIYRSLNHLNK